jgi:hypothetical protein
MFSGRYATRQGTYEVVTLVCRVVIPSLGGVDNTFLHSKKTRRLGNTILVKLELWELVIVFNKKNCSATTLCLRYASAKCGR